MAQQITKQNSVVILTTSIKLGQQNGCFLLGEAAMLKKAIDYFNPEVTTKPTFDSQEDPEIISINALLQGVQKIQSSKNNPFSIEDSALLWDIIQFWVKSTGQVAAPEAASSSEEAPEEVEEDVPITVSKGKLKAV